MKIGKALIVVEAGEFVEIVFLKEGSNELDMFAVLKPKGKLEEFKHTLVEGLRVHLVELIPF